jgi:ATP-dependent Lhr-like helicase
VETALERLMAEGVILRGEFRPGGVEREWCDPEVLRLIRRRSLARLRREIEPVEPTTLARFAPAWHGVGSSATGVDRLAEVIAQLEGLALPASTLERDILPARMRDYAPQMLDELGASGEVVWVGMGSLGRDDGKIALYRPDKLALLLPARVAAEDEAEQGEGPVAWLHVALREHLAARGASFHRELLAAAFAAAAERSLRRPAEREMLDVLWDLVWAGEVTNDTFAPLRALRWPRRGRGRKPARARPGVGTRMGPPEAAGRWSLVSDTVRTTVALGGGTEPAATEQRAALAATLLERHGVVTRDAVAAEGIRGGFGAVYPVYREMEERGRVRRGYFVEGLGGAQFAMTGAVDRLRSLRKEPGLPTSSEPRTLLLAATDPANPYGAALAWPRDEGRRSRSPARVAGAYVVLHDGDPVLYLERGGRSMVTFRPFDDDDIATAAVSALRSLIDDGRVRRLQVERIDGERIAESKHKHRLDALGFWQTYKGFVIQAPERPGVRH